MEETVMIIVGKWDCLECGRWHFSITRNIFAKCVRLSAEDTFISFKRKVEAAFRTLVAGHMLLTFWNDSSESETVLTQAKMPPVSVESDESLDMFRLMREKKKGQNLFLSMAKDDSQIGEGAAERTNTEEGGMAESPTGGYESTSDEVEFLKQVNRIEDVYRRSTSVVDSSHDGHKVKKQKLAGELDNSGAQGTDEDSPIYDFDYMTELIKSEYPTQSDLLNSNDAVGRRDMNSDVPGPSRTTEDGLEGNDDSEKDGLDGQENTLTDGQDWSEPLGGQIVIADHSTAPYAGGVESNMDVNVPHTRQCGDSHVEDIPDFEIEQHTGHLCVGVNP